MKMLLGYLLSVLGPVAGFFAGKYTDPTVGIAVGSALSGVGGRMLHTTEAPGAKIAP